MDATAMALNQPIFGSSSSCVQSKVGRVSGGSVYMVRRGRPEMLSSGFCDQGHLQYYSNNRFGCCSSAMSGKQEKSEKEKKMKKTMKKKKQLKLLKGLARDLSTFSQIGFGLDADAALLDQVKGNMISEAAEALMEQLQKIRAQEKEAKRKMKEEKAKLKYGVNYEMSSSSSSSESSDSDCGEVINMNQLKRAAVETAEAPVTPIAAATATAPVTPITAVTATAPVTPITAVTATAPMEAAAAAAVEVCMGGKCRKSGGGALLAEFERAGVAAAGCKCMGKCRDGPNVKVVKEGGGPSVCVGVGLEDVGLIVDKLFDGNQNHSHNRLELASAS